MEIKPPQKLTYSKIPVIFFHREYFYLRLTETISGLLHKRALFHALRSRTGNGADEIRSVLAQKGLRRQVELLAAIGSSPLLHSDAED